MMPPRTKAHLKQVVILLDPDLHQAFKIATAEHGATMQEVLHQRVEEYASGVLRRRRRAGKDSEL